jgi:hypothetical protein
VWTNYSAAAVTNYYTKWGTFEDNAQVSNLAEISFGTAAVTGTAPVVTHFAVKDGSGESVRLRRPDQQQDDQ